MRKKTLRDVPLDVIQQWLKDADCDVRQAAMNACQGRDVPLDVIRKGLKDADCDVRQAAMNACQANGIPIPIIRNFEPPESVYKRCVADVIVVAEIPKDAQVRGNPSGRCRANKAIIKQVVGTVFGENVGISIFDRTTTYYEGDEVIIDDFDLSDEECSTGFHFFCTLKQAKEYR